MLVATCRNKASTPVSPLPRSSLITSPTESEPLPAAAELQAAQQATVGRLGGS